MTPFSALDGLRIGCVQYLNAKPLIVPYEGPVVFEHPAALADSLNAGEIDVALVPVFEALRNPEFPIADGIAIASRGPVYSVILAYAGELRALRTVHPDPVSRTSNNMVRCILTEFHGLRPEYRVATDETIAPETGRVIIGNHAIAFRENAPDGVRILDLGEEWLAQTGLPFVYAVWQIRPEVRHPARVAEALRAVKTAGARRVRQIARLQTDFSPQFAEHYLTEHIKFSLDQAEKAGLKRFRALLQKQGLLPKSETGLTFL